MVDLLLNGFLSYNYVFMYIIRFFFTLKMKFQNI